MVIEMSRQLFGDLALPLRAQPERR